MKKSFLLIFCFYFIYVAAGEIQKPILKFSTKSNCNFYSLNDNISSIYPYNLKDKFTLSISENFSSFFNLLNKMEFNYSSHNKYNKDLKNLSSYSFKSHNYFCFNINKQNRLGINIIPMYYYHTGENYFKNKNQINYKFKTKIFNFTTSYSHLYDIGFREIFYHKINFRFLWYFPGKKFLKYKTTTYIYLQHGIYEELDKPLLKSINITFEMIIDFNQLTLDNFEQNQIEQENESGFFND